MITLFTIDCPKCKMLENKLAQSGVQYEVCKDRNIMAERGFDFLPVLEVDEEILCYSDALKWINERS